MPNSPAPRPTEPSTWDHIVDWAADVHTWTADHIDWGDAPTWLAFIAAFAAAIYTGRALQRERNRDAAATVEQKRRQATQISAWADASAGQATWSLLAHVAVLNLSEQPVTRVRVILTVDQVEHLVDELRVLPPGSREVRLSDTVVDAVLPTITETNPPEQAALYGAGFIVLDWADRFRDLAVSIEFTDAAGVRWLRDEDGLREIDTAPHLVRKPLPPDPAR